MANEGAEKSGGRGERAALVAAAATAIGSLYLSLGMGLVACPLCFYQRSFILAAAAILGAGTALRLPVPPGTLSLLALPLAVSGLGVAAAHCGLVWSGVLACPRGILGLGSAPEQSLAGFLLVTALLLPGAGRRGLTCAAPPLRVGSLVVLGAVTAILCIVSSPKLPPFNPKYDAAGNRLLPGCERAAAEAPAGR